MIARILNGTGFRDRLRSGEPMLGTFVKFPTSQAIEILGSEGFDFVVIDAEHAPLGRAQIDLMILAARAVGISPVVRVGHPEQVLNALDCGAEGVMVPHVRSRADAESIAALCRYSGGLRGFAGLTRAGGWGARKPHDPEAAAKVSAMSAIVAKSASAAGKPLLMLATSTKDATDMRALGVRALLISSDHAMLKSAAATLYKDYAGAQ